MIDRLQPIIPEEPLFLLRTKHGCEIPVYRGKHVSEEQKLREDEHIRRKHLSAQCRRGSDPSYNCHGLTFVARARLSRR